MKAKCERHGNIETVHFGYRESPYDLGQCPLCVQEGVAEPGAAEAEKIWPHALEPIVPRHVVLW